MPSPLSPALYLIPNTLGNVPLPQVLPAYNIELIAHIRHYVVEDLRSARRFLSAAGWRGKIDELRFNLLNEHSKPQDRQGFLSPILQQNESVGLISEAGLPCVADPGKDLVADAHRQRVRVVPLVGPSSLMMALMASGFNGQNFAFVGYVPREPKQREQVLRQMEKSMYALSQTQIMIEAPYRNMALYESLLKVCAPSTALCIASEISTAQEWISTKSIAQWRTLKSPPPIHKRNTVFLLYK